MAKVLMDFVKEARSQTNEIGIDDFLEIIEDEPELVRVLGSYLKDSGYSVLTAFRGDSGFAIWEQKRPELVILDLNLPGLDGIEVARRIRGPGHSSGRGR